MAQRKLNKQQKKRIREQQNKLRQKAALNQSQHTTEQHLRGLVIQHHGKQTIIETADGEMINCSIRQNLGNLVCGDEVVYQHNDHDELCVILAIEQRRSELARPDFRRKPKPFAANIDQLVIVVAPQPELSQHLLDRYLVILESLSLQGIIVVNKTDLLNKPATDLIQQQMQEYQDLCYPVHYISAKTTAGLDALLKQLNGKRSILVGQSGVGKSTLIASLIPDLEIRTGKLSQANHGKHTTSSSTLYHLPTGGDIIDSPGVRDFALWHIDEQRIADGFVEFQALKSQCRFHNCRHLNEPACAIKAASETGEISPRRLLSYQQMLAEINEGI